MKNVLIITYYWPPASGPGVQRWLKFVKYLSLENLKITVFTTFNPSVPFEDKSLIEDVPESLEVIRSRSIEPIFAYNLLNGKWTNKTEMSLGEIKNANTPLKKLAKKLRSNVFIPDAKIGWYLNVRKRVLRLVKKKKIDIVVTTGPPHSTHLIGRYIKEKMNIPWITDFRDPWTDIFYDELLVRSEFASTKNKNLEKSVLELSDHILMVSKGLLKQHDQYADKITVVHNGYDPEDLPENGPVNTTAFVIRYIGNLKSNQNIVAFYQAIKELRSEVKMFDEYFRLEFVGGQHSETYKILNDLGIEDLVSYFSFVSHEEAIKAMQESNMLFLPIPRSEHSKTIITGKIFEYLASRTPILAIGPKDGNAAKILEECKRDVMISYDDKDELKLRIRKYFLKWLKSENYVMKIENNEHLKYSRAKLSEKINNLIVAILSD